MNCNRKNDIELAQKVSKKLSGYVDNALNFTLDETIFENNSKTPREVKRKSFSGKSLRRFPIKNCIFIECDFTSVSFSGCKIEFSKFINCNFNSASMQNCDINYVDIYNPKSNSYPSFRNSYLENVNFPQGVYDSNFNNAYLFNCKFKNDIRSCNLENTVFEFCEFINVSVIESTIEYATFKNIKSKELLLPFAQIPYIYNGLNYVLNSNDKVGIRTAKSKKNITNSEYKILLFDLEKYYITANKFFPLINIYITLHKPKKAFEAIISGLEYYFKDSNFREITNICRIISLCNLFTYKQREQIHDSIIKYAQRNITSKSKRYYYNFYYPEITSLLLYNISNLVKIEFQIQTGVKETDYKNIAYLYKILDETTIVLLSSTDVCYIDISHNSDILCNLSLIVDPTLVPIYISAIYYIFSKGEVVFDKISVSGLIAKFFSNIKSIKKDIIDIKNMDKESELNMSNKQLSNKKEKNIAKIQELEIEKKKTELELLKLKYAYFTETKKNEFSNSKIPINQISHNITTMTNSTFSTEISSYIYTKH